MRTTLIDANLDAYDVIRLNTWPIARQQKGTCWLDIVENPALGEATLVVNAKSIDVDVYATCTRKVFPNDHFAQGLDVRHVSIKRL